MSGKAGEVHFYLSQGEEREDKKEQYTHRINSNLPGESIARERRSIVFVKQRKITPNLQKAIPEIKKRTEKHNTQKITQI